MVFFKTIAFLIAANALPVLLMWSAGQFVGQKKPHPTLALIIRNAFACMTFLVFASAAFYSFLHYKQEWYRLPLTALIAGVGISAVICVNEYQGDRPDGTDKPNLD